MQKKAWLPIKIILFLAVFLAFPRPASAYYTNMPASLVIGQPDFTSNSPGTTAASLRGPAEVFVDNHGRMLVADVNNNRVLIWNSVPTTNGVSADLVLGQADFDSGLANRGGSRAANTLSGPTSVYSDGQRLFVVDNGNRRVLIWNTFPTSNGQAADIVVGQVSMTEAVSECTESSTERPYGLTVYQNRLIVTDRDLDRALIWNNIPTSNGAQADVVIGQQDLTTCNASSATQYTITSPRGVAVDSKGRLYIVDDASSRLLIWNSVPTTNYAPADVVVGQPDFTTATQSQFTDSTFGATTLRGVYSNGSRLFMPDATRVLIFDSIPTSNGVGAEIVLGQDNFMNGSRYGGGSISARGFAAALRVFEYENKLLVVESANNRILIFEDYEATATPGFTVNYPPESSGEKMRLTGNIVMGEYGRFDLRSPEVSINNQGFGPLTNFSKRQHSDHETITEFYHDFEPWAGVAPRDQWSEGDGFTAHFRATSYQSKIETQEAFLFWPFTLDSVNADSAVPVFSFHIPSKNVEHIKSNLDRFEVYIGNEGSFSKYLKRVPINLVGEDGRVTVSGSSEGVQTAQATFLPGEYEVTVRAVDKWGNHFDSNAIPLILTQALVSVESTPLFSGFWFPLQINRATGINTGIISSFRPESVKGSYTTTTLTPTFSGIAFADSLITMTVVNSQNPGEVKTFTATTGPDSTFSLTPTLYPDSTVSITAQKAGLSTQIPPFGVRLFNPQ